VDGILWDKKIAGQGGKPGGIGLLQAYGT